MARAGAEARETARLVLQKMSNRGASAGVFRGERAPKPEGPAAEKPRHERPTMLRAMPVRTLHVARAVLTSQGRGWLVGGIRKI